MVNWVPSKFLPEGAKDIYSSLLAVPHKILKKSRISSKSSLINAFESCPSFSSRISFLISSTSFLGNRSRSSPLNYFKTFSGDFLRSPLLIPSEFHCVKVLLETFRQKNNLKDFWRNSWRNFWSNSARFSKMNLW